MPYCSKIFNFDEDIEFINRHYDLMSVSDSPSIESLCMSKGGSRAMQDAIRTLNPRIVKYLVESMEGFEVSICLNENGTHVIDCLLDLDDYDTYSDFLRCLAFEGNICLVMENKMGCRIIRKALSVLTSKVNSGFVPPVLNDLVTAILTQADRFVRNENANYCMQYIISAFHRQRDYIIDQVILGNILELAQGKYSSHVVETALSVAGPDRLARMFSEIFYDYKVSGKQPTPLEVLIFNPYGNYVVQKLLQIAIDVTKGHCVGDPNWLNLISGTVARNINRLKRYSFGKSILHTLAEVQPSVYSGTLREIRRG